MSYFLTLKNNKMTASLRKNPFTAITSPGEAWATLFAGFFAIGFIISIPSMFNGLPEAVLICAAPFASLAFCGLATTARGAHYGDEKMENRGFWIQSISSLVCILCFFGAVVLKAYDPTL